MILGGWIKITGGYTARITLPTDIAIQLFEAYDSNTEGDEEEFHDLPSDILKHNGIRFSGEVTKIRNDGNYSRGITLVAVWVTGSPMDLPEEEEV